MGLLRPDNLLFVAQSCSTTATRAVHLVTDHRSAKPARGPSLIGPCLAFTAVTDVTPGARKIKRADHAVHAPHCISALRNTDRRGAP